MTGKRFSILQNVQVQKDTHAGLWLDKFLRDTDEGAKKNLVDQIAQTIKPNGVYKRFYKHWKQAMEENGAVCKEAHVQGRLAINLGAEAILETSIALHHTYGTPYIPGSALKGLASHYAMKHLDENEWGKDSQAFKILFGSPDSAGYVTFFDALYAPGSGFEGQALWSDVITVHHPDYYQTGSTPPADWDSPTPIPFLTATGDYLVALAGPEEWVKAAFEILTLALEHEGVGAKTSSGYGRMLLGEKRQEIEVSTEPYALTKNRLLKEESPPPGRARGTVAQIERGGDYGWINPAEGGGQVFVHHNQLKEKSKRFAEGQVLEYSLGTYRGKTQAQEVSILLEPS